MNSTQTQPDLPIIFEDPHLLIIDKPHGVLSQEDHTGDPDVYTLCKEYINRSSGSNYLGLLHRLDRPVGGLMMLAKTPQAAQDISQQIRDRVIQKTYYAVVEGQPPENGLLTHCLLKNNDRNVVETVSEESGKGKEAVLSFTKKKQKRNLALLAVHLHTADVPIKFGCSCRQKVIPSGAIINMGARNRMVAPLHCGQWRSC